MKAYLMGWIHFGHLTLESKLAGAATTLLVDDCFCNLSMIMSAVPG